jgi:hypothetical protein
MRDDDGIRKGGPRDPVAQSVRNEQMQDAIPSDAEREELAREANTCDECGEHKRDEVRERWNDDYSDECPARQHPTPGDMGGAPPRVCDDCASPVETKLDIIEQHFIEGDDYVVEYGCGVLKNIDSELHKPAGEGGQVPFRGWSPEVGIEHRCGATIERVWTPDDDEVFVDDG